MFAEAKAKVALPVATVWNRLTDLRSMSQWAPDVAASPADGFRLGATRWARLYKPIDGKDVLIERITDIDVARRTFTYDIEGGIGPMASIQTTWRVSPTRSGAVSIVTVTSTLTLSGRARLLPILLLRRWTTRLQTHVDGFARWAKDLDGDVEFMAGPDPVPEPQNEVSVELVELEGAEVQREGPEAPVAEAEEAPVRSKTVKRKTARRPAKTKGR